MASPSAQSTTKAQWIIRPVTLTGVAFPLARLNVRVYLASTAPGPPAIPHTAWLDTGAPLSVIPFHVQQKGLHWQRLPGIKATWSGQPCDLGHIDFWLATDQPPYLRGPMPLLAKFPHSDPTGPPVPVLLGLEFFLTHRATLQLFLPPQHGIIGLP